MKVGTPYSRPLCAAVELAVVRGHRVIPQPSMTPSDRRAAGPCGPRPGRGRWPRSGVPEPERAGCVRPPAHRNQIADRVPRVVVEPACEEGQNRRSGLPSTPHCGPVRPHRTCALPTPGSASSRSYSRPGVAERAPAMTRCQWVTYWWCSPATRPAGRAPSDVLMPSLICRRFAS